MHQANLHTNMDDNVLMDVFLTTGTGTKLG